MTNQIKCICGEEKVEITRIPTEKQLDVIASNKHIRTGRCVQCGLIRQMDLLFANEIEYAQFYRDEYPPVHDSYSAKDYEHDLEISALRCEAYKIKQGSGERILDVGSGSGAFVDRCRRLGAEAYGCDIGKYSYSRDTEDAWIYRRRFEDVHFPTDHFDKVVCHDVVEHVLNPVCFIAELFRITKQNGLCAIELPNYHEEAGRHHWKAEHIWYFTAQELQRLLKKAGFVVSKVKKPITSKLVFYATKPVQDRTRILLPPGIGDSWWTLVKLQSFIEQNEIGLPDVCVVCNHDQQFQGHRRSLPFLEMFPFLHSTGEVFENGPRPKLQEIWKEAYGQEGRTTFRNVHGCDYFIAYNGHLRVGKRLEDIDPHLECNWNPPMFVSLEQERYKEDAFRKYGPYIVWYFVFQGTYKKWTNEFPISRVINLVNTVSRQTGRRPVFVGSQYDAQQEELQRVVENIPDRIDLRGKTSVEQVFGLMRGADLMVGYPSGLSIMGATLGVKTLIIWNNYYNKDFAWHCCPSSVKNKTYFIENTKGIPEGKLEERIDRLVGGQKDTSIRRSMPIPKLNPVKRNGVVTAVCVLRSGRDFSVNDVEVLRNMIQRNVTVPYNLVCLTDIKIPSDVCDSILLEHNFEKWWSKIEMFRPDICDSEYMIYFDLDTVITANIDDLFVGQYEFHALRPWNKRNRENGMFASGLMAWRNGSYLFLYENFHLSDLSKYPIGDQQYMSRELEKNGVTFVPIQDVIPGIYSFKRSCRRQLPEDARIVCFHGKPRPREVASQWVAKHWR